MDVYNRRIPMVQCPFNKAHFLRVTRLQYHLVKCIKTYKGNKIACPYNASEYVEPEDMVEHLAHCKSRVEREKIFLYSVSNREKGFPAPFLHDHFETDENWGIDSPDEEEDTGKIASPYNAREYVEPVDMVDQLAHCKSSVERGEKCLYSVCNREKGFPVPFLHDHFENDTSDEDEDTRKKNVIFGKSDSFYCTSSDGCKSSVGTTITPSFRRAISSSRISLEFSSLENLINSSDDDNW